MCGHLHFGEQTNLGEVDGIDSSDFEDVVWADAHAISLRFATGDESVETRLSQEELVFRAHLAMTVLETTGKAVAAMQLSDRETRRWATNTAAMIASHVLAGVVEQDARTRAL